MRYFFPQVVSKYAGKQCCCIARPFVFQCTYRIFDGS